MPVNSRLQIAIVLLLAMATLCVAQQTMKITLTTGEVSEEFLSEIGKIVFSDAQMVTGTIYDLDAIRKIEFYDEAEPAGTERGLSHVVRTVSADIGLACAGGMISLTLPSRSQLRVSLCDVTGRIAADLFDGAAEAGTLSLSLKNAGLTAGMYGLVVKADGRIFARIIAVAQSGVK